MIDRNRVALAACGLLILGAAVAFPATAAADDLPPQPLPVPGDPAPAPPPGPTVPGLGQLGPGGLGVLAQSGEAAAPGALGAPQGIVGLDPTTLLGQNPAPAAPGGGFGAPPSLNVFNNAYGIQQYEVPSAPGGKQFDVAPGDENADVTQAAVVRPLHRHAAGRPNLRRAGASPAAATRRTATRHRTTTGHRHPAGTGAVPARPGRRARPPTRPHPAPTTSRGLTATEVVPGAAGR